TYSYQGTATPTSSRTSPRPRGPHPTSTVSQGEASGPVTHLGVTQFEPRLDDRQALCLSISMDSRLTGELHLRHTLADGTSETELRDYDLRLGGPDEDVLGPN